MLLFFVIKFTSNSFRKDFFKHTSPCVRCWYCTNVIILICVLFLFDFIAKRFNHIKVISFKKLITIHNAKIIFFIFWICSICFFRFHTDSNSVIGYRKNTSTESKRTLRIRYLDTKKLGRCKSSVDIYLTLIPSNLFK